MTKQDAINSFKGNYSNFTTALNDDRVAICEDWNNFTDMLCQNEEITDTQYSNWSNPF